MTNDVSFTVTTTPFDEDYVPSDDSRLTTNFANLARGEHRQQNLRTALAMIDRRCNDLASEGAAASAGDPAGGRYRVELEIVSVTARFHDGGPDEAFPLLEMLDVTIVDQSTGERHQGIVGNNFSSYLRDYDFAVLLPSVNAPGGPFTVPDDFGDLHGLLFRKFVASDAYRDRFPTRPVICISVSTSQTYRRTVTRHPVLGVEYAPDGSSLTDAYFGRMGMEARYFMPRGAAAPLAFYHRGDLLDDHTDLQLIGTISTMETFQKIYRPEVYAATTPAGDVYRPTLEHQDHVRTPVVYDRVERSQLAITQGRYAQEHLVEPHRDLLERWTAQHATPTR